MTAQNLYRKAKRGSRLTRGEMAAVEGFATRMRELVGTHTIDVAVPAGLLAGSSIPVPPELVLHGDRAVITLRGLWLADTVTGSVVGRYANGPDTLTLFPNSVMLVTDLARLVKSYHTP